MTGAFRSPSGSGYATLATAHLPGSGFIVRADRRGAAPAEGIGARFPRGRTGSRWWFRRWPKEPTGWSRRRYSADKDARLEVALPLSGGRVRQGLQEVKPQKRSSAAFWPGTSETPWQAPDGLDRDEGLRASRALRRGSLRRAHRPVGRQEVQGTGRNRGNRRLRPGTRSTDSVGHTPRVTRWSTYRTPRNIRADVVKRLATKLCDYMRRRS